MFKQTKFEVSFITKVVGFFTVDTSQSVLRYFYFKKYPMDGDIVIVVKFFVGLLMIGYSLLILAFAVFALKLKNMKRKDWLIASVYVILSIVPVFRLIRLIIQASNKGSMIRADCLEYRISFTNNQTIHEIDQYELDYYHNYQ